MDYDDIDYDEGYSMIDIDNNWSNSNMDYDEIDSNSNSEIDYYNYNSSTNNWSTLTGDKINRQTNKHNDSFLDIINKNQNLWKPLKDPLQQKVKMIAFWTSMKD